MLVSARSISKHYFCFSAKVTGDFSCLLLLDHLSSGLVQDFVKSNAFSNVLQHDSCYNILWNSILKLEILYYDLFSNFNDAGIFLTHS